MEKRKKIQIKFREPVQVRIPVTPVLETRNEADNSKNEENFGNTSGKIESEGVSQKKAYSLVTTGRYTGWTILIERLKYLGS